MLRKIECYLTPGNLDPLRDMLLGMGIEGMTLLDAQGFGTRSKKKDGKPQLEKRVKVEVVVDEAAVNQVIAKVRKLAVNGLIGSGIIFVVPIEDAVRLSTREVGKSAIF